MYPVGAIYLLVLLAVQAREPAKRQTEEVAELKDYDGLDYKPPVKPARRRPDLRRVK